MVQGREYFVVVVYLIVLNYANFRKVFLLCFCSSSLCLIDERPTKISKILAKSMSCLNLFIYFFFVIQLTFNYKEPRFLDRAGDGSQQFPVSLNRGG